MIVAYSEFENDFLLLIILYVAAVAIAKYWLKLRIKLPFKLSPKPWYNCFSVLNDRGKGCRKVSPYEQWNQFQIRQRTLPRQTHRYFKFVSYEAWEEKKNWNYVLSGIMTTAENVCERESFELPLTTSERRGLTNIFRQKNLICVRNFKDAWKVFFFYSEKKVCWKHSLICLLRQTQ